MAVKKTWLQIPLAFVIGLSFCLVASGQENENGVKQQDIESNLADILKNLPEESVAPKKGERAKNSSSSASGAAKRPAAVVQKDIVKHLESQIAKISETKRTDQTTEQKKELHTLKAQLKIAKMIEAQLVRTKRAKHIKENRGTTTAADSFVVAHIAVAAKSKTADITFASMDGETETTSKLYEFVKQASNGGFRDYRIMGRYNSASMSSDALAQVRKDYDEFKERERKMLQYIAARNQAMARVKQSKRC